MFILVILVIFFQRSMKTALEAGVMESLSQSHLNPTNLVIPSQPLVAGAMESHSQSSLEPNQLNNS